MFAAEPVKKGAVIWRADPVFDIHISAEQYAALQPHARELIDRYAYPSTVRPGFLVFEADNGRFMNHAAKPNTDYSELGYGTATADIGQGEELTCDYGQFFGEAISEEQEKFEFATK